MSRFVIRTGGGGGFGWRFGPHYHHRHGWRFGAGPVAVGGPLGAIYGILFLIMMIVFIGVFAFFAINAMNKMKGVGATARSSSSGVASAKAAASAPNMPYDLSFVPGCYNSTMVPAMHPEYPRLSAPSECASCSSGGAQPSSMVNVECADCGVGPEAFGASPQDCQFGKCFSACDSNVPLNCPS